MLQLSKDIMDDKEKSEEARYKLRQEFDFKIRSRRNRLLGLWAAGRKGLTGKAAADYATDLVLAGMEAKSDADLTAKVFADVKGPGVTLDEVTQQVVVLTNEARRRIEAEFPAALAADHARVGD